MQLSAPGKLILTGEYAVLDGAPGLVMAINRRARVSLEPSTDNAWHLVSLQDQRSTGSFTLDERGLPRWDQPASKSAFQLVDTLLRAWEELALQNLPPFKATLDTSEFFDPGAGGQKLGLGSSAALTVALSAALQDWAGIPPLPREEQLAKLLAMHRDFQGGRGSGIDLAASLCGGILDYQRPPGSSSPRVEPGTLPAALKFRAIWTGKQASTSDLLRQLETATEADPGGWNQVRGILASAASQSRNAFISGRAEELISSIAAYGKGLRLLQAFSGIQVFSPEHETLAELASKQALTYKPSGAGAGDLGLAFSLDPTALAQFCSEATRAGFRCPDLALETRGLTRHN
jgi:phosphomevalonate kinase